MRRAIEPDRFEHGAAQPRLLDHRRPPDLGLHDRWEKGDARRRRPDGYGVLTKAVLIYAGLKGFPEANRAGTRLYPRGACRR
jgi:hypothetical protein